MIKVINHNNHLIPINHNLSNIVKCYFIIIIVHIIGCTAKLSVLPQPKCCDSLLFYSNLFFLTSVQSCVFILSVINISVHCNIVREIIQTNKGK